MGHLCKVSWLEWSNEDFRELKIEEKHIQTPKWLTNPFTKQYERITSSQIQAARDTYSAAPNRYGELIYITAWLAVYMGQDVVISTLVRIRTLLGLTWVVSSNTGGTSEDLPAQWGVLSAVIYKHPLQRLGPVQLVQNSGSWEDERERDQEVIISLSHLNAKSIESMNV